MNSEDLEQLIVQVRSFEYYLNCMSSPLQVMWVWLGDNVITTYLQSPMYHVFTILGWPFVEAD